MAHTKDRDDELVKLITKLKKSSFKVTAVKYELEGAMEREDRCGEDCSLRMIGQPHEGCMNFSDVRVANDYLLTFLSKYGLAKRKRGGFDLGGRRESYLYAPKHPLVFSRVYTDSETEWTLTLSLRKPEDILLSPRIVDAFNSLAKANGNGIDVRGSGMHTAFLQGAHGKYPIQRPKGHTRRFKNFQRSMTPLLPALYLLGANRMDANGKAITRSIGPRCPEVSSYEKYSAIAYRSGALEFRVFDTCYDNREQILDNVAVMAQSVIKYWRKQYRDPGMKKFMTRPVYFGNDDMHNNINPLENMYTQKEHVKLLNEGLRRIKPPYLTIKDIKGKRNFTLTCKSLKNFDTKRWEVHYSRYVNQQKLSLEMNIARNYYHEIEQLPIESAERLAEAVEEVMARVRKSTKQTSKLQPIEQVAYQQEYGRGYLLGGM